MTNDEKTSLRSMTAAADAASNDARCARMTCHAAEGGVIDAKRSHAPQGAVINDAPLKRLLATLRVPQATLARAVDVSGSAIDLLVNHGQWPVKNHALRAQLQTALRQHGASTAQINRALDAQKQNPWHDNAKGSAAAPASTGAAPSAKETEQTKETDMLLQKQTLTQETRQHFSLAADPFTNDVTQASDVYVSRDIRYVRETLWQHARHGGLLAIVGESGSGKSTLVADFKDRLIREKTGTLVIEPSTLYMEENDTKGKTLKSVSIVRAILSTVAPSEPIQRDAESRARQVQKALTAGHRAGQRYVLLIEEAHCLPTATLKHLKRFAELKDGLAPLLAIVLIGQPELRERLSVTNVEVREVAQRCDIVELGALGRGLGEYIDFKFRRVGAEMPRIITTDGVEALRERLTFTRRNGKGPGDYVSLAYPLAVANALTRAMNLAASLGAPVVDADIVREAR